MKKKAKRLRLSRETIKRLNGDKLKTVAGAFWCSAPNATCSCNTSYEPCGPTADASCALHCDSYDVC